MAITSHRKAKPVGIDQSINQLQDVVEMITFHVDPVWESFPRVYKNPQRFNEKGYIPEYATDTNDYKEVLMDDNNDITSFFVIGSRRPFENGLIFCDISFIVQMELDKVFPDMLHRADEEAKMIFFNQIRKHEGYLNMEINSIEEGVENVYREFIKSEMVFNDMSEKHFFRINLTANYLVDCE